MITLSARRISSFATQKEVPRVWRSLFLDAAVALFLFGVIASTKKYESIHSTESFVRVGVADVGSCEREDFDVG